MIELPTFYGWLMRIAGVGLIVLMACIYAHTEDKYPLLAKYIVMPMAMIVTVAVIIIFIITQ